MQGAAVNYYYLNLFFFFFVAAVVRVAWSFKVWYGMVVDAVSRCFGLELCAAGRGFCGDGCGRRVVLE